MKRLPSILLLLAAAGPSRAAVPTEPPNPLPAASVASRVLPNGLTVLVRRDANAPLAVVDLWVRAGSVDDAGSGAAHALEHMVFRGGKGVPAGNVDAAVEAAGGTIYASTLAEATHYWTAVPPDQTGVALSVLADAMRAPDVEAALWDRERRVMLEEIARSQGDALAEARRVLAGRLYGAAYAAPVAGTPAALGRLTPDAIRAFHRRYYTPDRMTLVIVGPVDTEKVVAQAGKALGALSRRAGDAAPARLDTKTASGPVDVEVQAGGSVAVGVAWPAPGESAAVDVLCGVLRNRLSGALGGMARRVEVTHPWQRAGMVAILVEGAPADSELLRRSLDRALVSALNDIRPAEVQAAARRRQWSWWLDLEKPASQSRALGLAASVGTAEDATGLSPRLARVSAGDVQNAARTVMGTSRVPSGS